MYAHEARPRPLKCSNTPRVVDRDDLYCDCLMSKFMDDKTSIDYMGKYGMQEEFGMQCSVAKVQLSSLQLYDNLSASSPRPPHTP